MRIVIVLLALSATVAPAAAKEYRAERFDAVIRVLQGGDLEVTETVRFRFEDGTFTEVFREIRERRTDGLDILRAEMDGRPLGFGTGPGEVEVRDRSKVRVLWRFAPRSGSTHTFTLTYRARGVAERRDGRDVVAWQALPHEHKYAIDASRVVIEHPGALVADPEVETKRIGGIEVTRGDGRVTIEAQDIGRDGWVVPRLSFSEGTIVTALPAWQQRRLEARARAPLFWTAAGFVLAAGLLVMLALRRGYEAPPRDQWTSTTESAPPDQLRPALAGALASNGPSSLPHVMGTLVTLADAGALAVTEQKSRWGQRDYLLRRRQSARHPSPEATALLDVVFAGGADDSVALSKASQRISSKFGAFKRAVYGELQAAGLLDPQRERVRRHYLRFGIGAFAGAALTAIPAAFIVRQYEGWPFLVAAAAAIVGVVSLVVYGALTPLSNDGVRRAERWRAFGKHVRSIARGETSLSSHSAAQLTPYAVALGHAGAWSKFLTQHDHGAPAWFSALASSDGQAGFSAFIASSGMAASAGGGHTGAAGGGSSGAR